jgi:hypothetical protein
MAQTAIDLAREFVERKLVPWAAFEAALITGSVGHGEARLNSDVDMILVFDPLDVRIVPGEFVWTPVASDDFHPIVGAGAVEATEVGGIQIDAKRRSLDYIEKGDLADGFKHELAHALVLFDRSGRVGRILARRLAFPIDRRRALALRHREWAWIHQSKVSAKTRDRWLGRVGWAGVVDVLVGGLEEVVLLIHACNGEFPPYRYRSLLSMQQLDWVPRDFSRFRDAVLVPATGDAEANVAYACEAFDVVLSQVDARFRELDWAEDAGNVWVQSHPELGFAYNMDQWKRAHQALLAERDEAAR